MSINPCSRQTGIPEIDWRLAFEDCFSSTINNPHVRPSLNIIHTFALRLVSQETFLPGSVLLPTVGADIQPRRRTESAELYGVVDDTTGARAPSERITACCGILTNDAEESLNLGILT